MPLQDYCKEENLQWSNLYAKAFRAEVGDGEVHTVIRFQIPFSAEDEQLFLARYGMQPEDRVGFYQNLVRCIQQAIKAAEILAKANVPSILRYLNVEQTRTKQGVSYIYLETEEIQPIREALLSKEIDRMSAINIGTRIAIVLRDIAKPPVSMVMRCLDINDIYVNKENRILLGGFYYAAAPDLPEPPPFLPTCPKNIRADVKTGGYGDAGADMYALSCILWNLHAGLPLETQLPDNVKVYPQYASTMLAETLLMGRSGEEDKVREFRKRIGECRKTMAKQPEAAESFPIREQIRKEYRFEWQ